MLFRNDYGDPSILNAKNLLREARRQKSITKASVPHICILDPDGDIVEYLRKEGQASPNASWGCYHTDLHTFLLGKMKVGIVGYAVGSSFAVLVAEELFASGCKLLISMTSAGRLHSPAEAIRFLLISKSLRDEGTSRNYVPSAPFAHLDAKLLRKLSFRLKSSPVPIGIGTAWTTDAPFRETERAIAHAVKHSAECVEMESAALYSFAHACKRNVICIAHLTNSMAQSKGDFEKGVENGSIESLNLIRYLIKAVRSNKTKDLE